MILLTRHWIELFLFYILLAATALCALNQVRKPSKWIGRFFLWIMNISHSTLTDWGLTHVQIEGHFTILDVGCGGGKTIEKLAALAPEGEVYGIDYAPGSVAASHARNARFIQTGRVEIIQASVSQLSFPDNKFDLVTAVETQYYWPDPMKDMQEPLRVLKPGGTLLVIAESYRKGSEHHLYGSVIKLLRTKNLSVEDHQKLFSAAGYREIQIFEQRRKAGFAEWARSPGSFPSSSLPQDCDSLSRASRPPENTSHASYAHSSESNWADMLEEAVRIGRSAVQMLPNRGEL